MTPPDDLYARLEVATDASPEVIEVAWRSLLRLHHPDVAGPQGSSARSASTSPTTGSAILPSATDTTASAGSAVTSACPASERECGRAAGTVRRARTEPSGMEAVRGPRVRKSRRTRRVRVPAIPRRHWPSSYRGSPGLTRRIDRLACAEATPIAFGATIARFLHPTDWRHSRRWRRRSREAGSGCGGPTGSARRRGGIRDRARARRLSRRLPQRAVPRTSSGTFDPWLGGGGRAAALRPERRCCPRAHRSASRARSRRSGRARGGRAGSRVVAADDSWPPSTSPDEDEALRVSSVLGARDAAAAFPARGDPAVVTRARRSAARLAHLLVLRHAFAPASFAALTARWRPRFLPEDQRGPRVRRPS